MSRKIIRGETDDFINRSQGSISYIMDNRSATPRFPPGIQTTDALRQAIADEHPELTGVIEATLPMTISVPDFDGHKIQITLLINPENLNHGKTNHVTAAYTRKGWITQAWGPNQDVLTGNGRTVAFMVDGVGVTTFFRRQSFGYLNFMSLMNAYKNNGYRMLDPTQPRLRDKTRVALLIYGVEITYDNQFMMGHFNNFTLDEAAENPYLFNYNFEFVISTNSEDFNNVRGHFNQLRPKGDPRTNFISQDKPGEIKAERTGSTLTLVNGVRTRGADAPITPMKPVSDEFLIRLWKEKTGSEFDVAVEMGFTDDSVLGNLNLKAELLEGEFDDLDLGE